MERLQQSAPKSLAVPAPPPCRCLVGKPVPLFSLAAPDNADDYARTLYANLRTLDATGAEWIVVVTPPLGERWLPIHDRLQRAQAGSLHADSNAEFD